MCRRGLPQLVHRVRRWWIAYLIIAFAGAVILLVLNNIAADAVDSTLMLEPTRKSNALRALRQPASPQFANSCATEEQAAALRRARRRWADTVVIVNINTCGEVPLRGAARFASLYAQFFPHLFFCGDDCSASGPPSSELLHKGNISVQTWSFEGTSINVHRMYTASGIFGYMCTALAIQLAPQAAGYLHVNDDAALNPHLLAQFSPDTFWLASEAASGHEGGYAVPLNSPPPKDTWWEFFGALPGFRTAFMNMPPQVQAGVLRMHGGVAMGYHMFADVSYVPGLAAQPWAQLASIFYDSWQRMCKGVNRYGCPYTHMEAVFPTTAWYLMDTLQLGLQHLPIRYLWREERSRWQDQLDYKSAAVHPVKLGQNATASQHLQAWLEISHCIFTA